MNAGVWVGIVDSRCSNGVGLIHKPFHYSCKNCGYCPPLMFHYHQYGLCTRHARQAVSDLQTMNVTWSPVNFLEERRRVSTGTSILILSLRKGDKIRSGTFIIPVHLWLIDMIPMHACGVASDNGMSLRRLHELVKITYPASPLCFLASTSGCLETTLQQQTIP